MGGRSCRSLALAAAIVAGCGPAVAAQARRAAAEVRCTPAGEAALAFACVVTLKDARSGEPLSGLDVTLGADMPSMPMAHNVRPVTAAPTGEPGAYQGRLELEMPGEWAVRVDIAGPMRDRIVQVLHFAEGTVSAPAASGGAGAHRHRP